MIDRMTASRRALRAVVLLALALTWWAGCSQQPGPAHEALVASADPLRTAFNRDAGRVRIVMLVAPT